MIKGRYGVFKVDVDGETVIDGGAAGVLGLLPTRAKILAAVKERLSATRV